MFFKASKKKGMTLIEIVISLAILAILIIPIANVVIKTSDTSKRAQDKQKASLLGQSILEQVGSINKDTTFPYNVNYADLKTISQSNQVTNHSTPILGVSNDVEFDCDDTGRYKASLTFKSELDNNNNDAPTPSSDTGEPFDINYDTDSALALEIAKDSANTFMIYNPVEGKSAYCTQGNKYVVLAMKDGNCNIYSTTQDINVFDEKKEGAIATIGKIDPSSKKIRMHLVGDEKLIKGKNSVSANNNLPFDFDSDTQIYFISKYESDFDVLLTKGPKASGTLKISAATKDTKSPHTVQINTYQSPTDSDVSIGNLYRATITIKDTKLKGDQTIFEGSTTCFIN